MMQITADPKNIPGTISGLTSISEISDDVLIDNGKLLHKTLSIFIVVSINTEFV
jgi:hypothetical protein